MNTHALTLATQAAERLRERIATEYGDDSKLIRDMIEGETDLHRLLGLAALELASVEGEKDGIEAAIGKMKERLARHCRKAEALRNGIEAAMAVAELGKLKTPAATLSMRPSPPRVEITDASALPAVFVTIPQPVPDKNAIKAALKEGQTVPGATLSNQPLSLSVRFT